MLYPDTDCDSWANRYGLSIIKRNCPKCGESFETTIPVAIKGYRGLQSPEHACGQKYANAVFVAVEKEEINFWISVKYGT